PAAAGFEFVGRGEQRFAGDDIDIDARLLVVEQFAGAGALGPALLGDAVLLGREAGNGLGALLIGWQDDPPIDFLISDAPNIGSSAKEFIHHHEGLRAAAMTLRPFSEIRARAEVRKGRAAVAERLKSYMGRSDGAVKGD